ncbi:hypothetical protein EDB83DRAFT_2372114 [Lactarius deliciosus]|nr:hypothetical protein EDB83DRAFT_2468937 [Lactarius deliciosus]KAH9069879.1 hypothetical protein EDB83DRAFT_2372114 [Lactarius deliciosus]
MGDGIILQYYARRPSWARCPPDLRPCARRLQNLRASSQRRPFSRALRPKTLWTQTPDLPTVQRLAPPSHVTPGLFTTEDASSADVDMLLGSADESDACLPPDRTRSTTSARNTGGDAASASALLRNSTALQEELAAQMAGQLQRNVGHFSGALAADKGVLRVAEESCGITAGKHSGRSV